MSCLCIQSFMPAMLMTDQAIHPIADKHGSLHSFRYKYSFIQEMSSYQITAHIQEMISRVCEKNMYFL